MTTLADQKFPNGVWTAISGLTLDASFSFQSKASNTMFVFEDSSAPAGGPVGVRLEPFEKYQFTKGSDDVFILATGGAGLASINGTT